MRFEPGDRVGVNDLGLRQLRVLMEQATGQPAPPNHIGTVERVENGLVYINFDEDGVEGAGSQAPYPAGQCFLIGTAGGQPTKENDRD